MAIAGIVAIAKNRAIGRDGKLPWHYSADLKFFKEITTGNAVVMGYNTWKSIGKPLPNRLNIVLTRSHSIPEQPDLFVLGSKEEVLKLIEGRVRDTFIIGGASIYKEFADVIDGWIVTEIPETIEDADTFMPEDFLDGFELDGEKNLGEGLNVKIYSRKE